MKLAKHNYDYFEYLTLEELFNEYLEHRIGHYSPYTTFKRYLVARDKRYYCDLFDDWRQGKTNFPVISNRVYSFRTHMRNFGDYGHTIPVTRLN